jgi:putative Mg2+ transporter-C (MgtC) family protein
MASYAFITTTGDSGRVAAQIVTGIGFLGAGAILHSAGIIRGMTTAATIWATAATGMIVGTGYAGAGLGMSVLVRLVLTGVHAWENRHWGGVRASVVEVVFQPDGGKTRVRIEKIMEDYHVAQSLDSGVPVPDGFVSVQIRIRLARRHRREFLNELAVLPEVKGIEEREA